VNPAAYSQPNFEEGISMSQTNCNHIQNISFFEHPAGTVTFRSRVTKWPVGVEKTRVNLMIKLWFTLGSFFKTPVNRQATSRRTDMAARFTLIAIGLLASTLAAQADDGTPTPRHANGEHPAVLVARQVKSLDPNTFLVQPPASVTWTVQPKAKLAATTASAMPTK
jgi:hypothetical protein